VSNSVTAITLMRAARGVFFGLLLVDGRVLVAGGSSGTGQPVLATAEAFEIAPETTIEWGHLK